MSIARRRRRLMASALLLGIGGTFGCSGNPQRASAGDWVTLLDAARLADWQQIGNTNWRAVDGVVQADGGGEGYLVSRGSYRDVEVRAEFWVDADANSGLFLRCQDAREITPFNSYEVNIFDNTPNAGFGTGSIVAVAKAPPTFKAASRWNTYEISARGPHIVVRLNGVQTVELNDARVVRGPIAIQRASGTVKFRKLEIRAL